MHVCTRESLVGNEARVGILKWTIVSQAYFDIRGGPFLRTVFLVQIGVGRWVEKCRLCKLQIELLGHIIEGWVGRSVRICTLCKLEKPYAKMDGPLRR